MQIDYNQRGFQVLVAESYPERLPTRLVGQSSVVGDYDDALERPGSSAIWVGDEHHLSREQVMQLIDHLQCWVETGYFVVEGDRAA